MAEEVEIIGVDGGPAAEATLKKLLEETKKASKPGSGDKIQQNYNTALKKGVKVTSKLSSSTKLASKALGKLPGPIGTVISGLAELAGALVSSALGFSKELAFGGREVEDFAQHIPLVGKELGKLASMATSQTNVFRDASEVGASFGNDILGMKFAAAAAKMPLEEFASLVSNNSTSLHMLGANITQGALRLSKLTEGVRFGDKQLMQLGLTTEQLNEGTASYIRMQGQSGRLQQMSDQELIAGTQSYLKEVDLLAKLTGTSRKEQQELMEARIQEANVQAMLSKLGKDEVLNFQSNMNMVDAILGKEVGGAFKDLADGVAQTDIGKKMQALSPQFAELAKQASTGAVSQEEFKERLKTMGPEFIKLRDSMGGAGVSALMSQAGFAEIFANLHKFEENMNSLTTATGAAADQAKRDPLSIAMSEFSQNIDTVRGNLITAFGNTEAFEGMKKGFAATVNGITTTAEAFGNWGETGLTLLDKIYQAVRDFNYNAWVSDLLTALKDGILDSLNILGKAGKWLGGAAASATSGERSNTNISMRQGGGINQAQAPAQIAAVEQSRINYTAQAILDAEKKQLAADARRKQNEEQDRAIQDSLAANRGQTSPEGSTNGVNTSNTDAGNNYRAALAAQSTILANMNDTLKLIARNTKDASGTI
jgi:hypothetical protein